MELRTATPAPPPSSFVTFLAWISIVLAGLMTFATLLQTAVFALLLPGGKFPLSEVPAMQGMPSAVLFVLDNLLWLSAAFLLVSIVLLASSIGLLLRKEWARIAFILFLALGVVWTIGGAFVQQMMFGSDLFSMGHAPSEYREDFEQTLLIVQITSVVTAVVFTAVHIWIIWKLCSGPTRAEFRGHG